MSDNNTTTDLLTTLKASDEAHLSAVMAALPHPGEWNTPHPNPYSPKTLGPSRHHLTWQPLTG